MCNCVYCRGKDSRAYHSAEADRIQAELDSIENNPNYVPGGIVRTVLAERVAQERRRAQR